MSQSGRSQLKDLLNDLVLQTTEENRESSPLEVDEDVEEAARELLEYSSPRKIHNIPIKARRSRKRSQRNSNTDTSFNEEDLSPSDPIVIYGRQLNSTKLSNVSSLYSVGREWVRNDPYGHRIDEHRGDIVSDNNLSTYSLPPPDISITDSDIFSPPPTSINTQEMDAAMASSNGLTTAQFQSLKQDYIKKWKITRERWKQKCQVRQSKYTKTVQALYDQR